MEVVVGALVAIIVGSLLLHLVKRGYQMYMLSSGTRSITQKLELAREQARAQREERRVIFDADRNCYGLDRNKNNRLDSAEADEMPSAVRIEADAEVTFTSSGAIAKGSKEPRISITTARDARDITVSSMGVISIE
jgi:hypothetical protein